MTRYGQNRGYIDELYKRFLADPSSVGEAWQEFFRDYRPETLGPIERSTAAAQTGGPAQESGSEPGAEPLRGIAGKIVENMTESLGVPTATSARSIPVKMLDENRRIINSHQSIIAGAKISFTHLIAWAVVRALERHPRMNSRFAEIDGVPHVVPRKEIHLGIAVDLERKGERVLLVPNLKHAESFDFPGFVAAYDDLILRARQNRLSVEDFQGTSVTLTNPGMMGTVLSVPRLMRDQGAIIGVGSIGLPSEYSGMAPEMISELGLSKIMTVTSTYDHRVIQGAESGQFLLTLERLLQGREGFYSRVFADLGVPREPVEWSGDRNPGMLGTQGNTEAIAKQAGVLQLVRAYRVRGHLWADLDPLDYQPEPNPELELSTYGLTVWDLDRRFITGGLGGRREMLQLRDILETLQRTYCRHVGVEFMHMQDARARHWIQETFEQPSNVEPLPRQLQVRILERLNAAEAFETFLHTNYVGQKRFSLEGAETLIPMLDVLLSDAAAATIDDVVIGLAHRGRLNVLAHVVGKPYGQIFREFEGIDPETALGSGDVKYHLGASGTYRTDGGREVRVSVASNPSHLEAVNPVVEGMARARQDGRGDREREHVLPVLIHGDGAFAGQGVVAETLNLSNLQGYRTGGTVHIVINNQIGFTTGPRDARSSKYPTDVAKMVGAPIFHVNGDHPEDAIRVVRHALAFRQEFKRDVVVDLFCYRRWGHNEADDPSYTHPILYSRIHGHRSVRKLYTEQLLRRGDFDIETAERALEDFRTRLREVHEQVRKAQRTPPAPAPDDSATIESRDSSEVDTAVPREMLESIVEGLGRTPEGFEPHAKLARQLARRHERFEEGTIDWSLGEALAFGSLVLEGTPVRLSGEDSGRGTFSQRHAVLYDHHSARAHVPLANLSPNQAPFTVYDSLLSELGVLGFEYGYSVDFPDALVMWEAQFGDFVNGAQVIIDQFLVCAEEKWGQTSRLVLLLPHGYEGQGPEHSSARLERFLQLASRGNIRVAVPTTPAQYFHLLRSQVHRERRAPLVVLTPKSLLRLPACSSAPEELSQGRFVPLLMGEAPAGETLRSLLLCSGKVFYDLDARRRAEGREDVAICRVERLYPLPAEELRSLFARLDSVRDVAWVQEEPKNMGAWSFVHERLPALLAGHQRLRYAGRPSNPSPATGSNRRHLVEQDELVRQALDTPRTETEDVGARVARRSP